MWDPLFALGLLLYAAEGTKSTDRFSFINSDPRLIQLMIKWLREVCAVPVDRIRASVYTAHKMYEDHECEAYWQRVTGFPPALFGKTIYKPTPHTTKKNPSFMGCCRLDVCKVDFSFVIKAWLPMLLDTVLAREPSNVARPKTVWEEISKISTLPRRMPSLGTC